MSVDEVSDLQRGLQDIWFQPFSKWLMPDAGGKVGQVPVVVDYKIL